jgi:hypothetical protein
MATAPASFSVESAGKIVTGDREQAEALAHSMIDNWLTPSVALKTGGGAGMPLKLPCAMGIGQVVY